MSTARRSRLAVLLGPSLMRGRRSLLAWPLLTAGRARDRALRARELASAPRESPDVGGGCGWLCFRARRSERSRRSARVAATASGRALRALLTGLGSSELLGAPHVVWGARCAAGRAGRWLGGADRLAAALSGVRAD